MTLQARWFHTSECTNESHSRELCEGYTIAQIIKANFESVQFEPDTLSDLTTLIDALDSLSMNESTDQSQGVFFTRV